MILNNEEWKPDDYEDIIHPSKPVKVALTLDNVIQFLGEQGADPETLKLHQQHGAVTRGYILKHGFSTRDVSGQISAY